MKLVLCCDYGVDDAVATVDALMHAGDDGYDSVVLIAIGGNVPPAVSLRNAQKLAAHASFCKVPIVLVDTTAEPQPYEFLKKIHGQDGMGDLLEDAAFASVPFATWCTQFEGAYDLLSLGPMTLVPRILRLGAVRKFCFMGGNIAETPNFHRYEFNHALDRAAFSAVVREWAHIAVTMDTCRHPLLNVQDLVIPRGGLQRDFVARAQAMTFVSGEKGCYLWDDIAVKALRHPEWFSLQQRSDRDGNCLTVARYIYGKPYLDILEQ